MVQRKLVKQGAATLMVSLPSKWCKAHNLTKGSSVDLIEREHEVSVGASAQSGIREITVDLRKAPESAVRTAIVNTYRAGFDKVILQLHDDSLASLVSATVRDYLLGFDVAQTGSKCVLESIAEPSAEQYDAVLRKMIQVVQLIVDGTSQRIENGNTFPYRDIVLRSHQYANFCHRVLTKEHLDDEHLSWSFLTQVIHAQRELYHLNKFLDDNTWKGKSSLTAALRNAYKLLREAYEKEELEPLERLHALEKEAIYEELYQEFSKQKNAGPVQHHLGSAIRQLYLAASPLTGLVLSGEQRRASTPKD